MLFAQDNGGLLALVCCLIIAGAELILRYSRSSEGDDDRTRRFTATHRLAVVAGLFVGVGFYLNLEQSSWGDVAAAGIIASIAAASLWPVCYLVVVVALAIWTHVLGDLWQRIRSAAEAVAARRAAQRELARRRRHDLLLQRQRHQAAQQAHAAQLRRQQEQASREDARLQCQLYFDRHKEELQPKFTQTELDAYFTVYLNDAQPLKSVQVRAGQLMSLLKRIVTGDGQQVKFTSLQQVAHHFEKQRREVRQLDYEADVLDTILIGINNEENDAISQFLSTRQRA